MGMWARRVCTCLLVATDATRMQMLASSFEMGIGKSADCCAHSSMSPIGGAPIEITIKLRLCGAPLRCKGLSYVAVGTYKQFCVGLGEDSGALPIDPATTAYRHGAQCSPTDSDLRASIVYAFRCDEGGGPARLASLHFERDSCE